VDSIHLTAAGASAQHGAVQVSAASLLVWKRDPALRSGWRRAGKRI